MMTFGGQNSEAKVQVHSKKNYADPIVFQNPPNTFSGGVCIWKTRVSDQKQVVGSLFPGTSTQTVPFKDF